MKKNITMKDIAKKLKISTVSVSKALNDKDGVSEELKEKIKAVAEEMGYRCNTVAKSMKDGVSYNVGVIIPEKFVGDAQSFYLNFYHHVANELEKYQYYGIMQTLKSADEEALNLPRAYYENRVDGFIILGQISKEYVELLMSINMPMVFLDFYEEHGDVDTVVTDNFYGSYEITNYLVKNGHQKIAFIGDIYATSSIQDRFLGYYKALLANKIDINYNYIFSDRDDEGKFIDIQLPESLPTAFVCNNDEVAYNLVNKLKAQGVKVPQDVSVVGFDNNVFATVCDPKLTTIEVDVKEMAKLSVRYIYEKVKNGDKFLGRSLVKGKLIIRDSVRVLEPRQ